MLRFPYRTKEAASSPSNDKTMTRLCTNLPRTPFSLGLVSRLYRFR
jgi:hypothetical protein